MDFTSYSESYQDAFVYEQLVKPHGNFTGTFLDIGCADPVNCNNTFSLEKLGWRGLLIDRCPTSIADCKKQRISPAIVADATNVDWVVVCGEYKLGTEIDYLSLDLDDHLGQESTVLLVLKNLISSGLMFRAITVEHDCYRLGDAAKNLMRELLLSHGYKLFAADVVNNHSPDGPLDTPGGLNGVPFEDWWIR